MPKLKNPDAYNMRSEVLPLKPLDQWTSFDEQVHLQHNRVLQEGFANRNPKDMINDAKLSGEQWLTDIMSPSVNSALVLHLGKEMVMNYKVGEEELNEVNHQVYGRIIEKNPEIITSLESKITSEIEQLKLLGGKLSEENLQQSAINRIGNNNRNLSSSGTQIEVNDETIAAAKRNIIEMERKRITSQNVAQFVKENIDDVATDLNLETKTIYPIGKNHDFSFAGAAGSGKSTVAKQFLTDQEKTDHIILATDNYRAFTIPGTEEHEQKNTKNVFTRTQDSAFLVKEIVLEELDNRTQERSNIIADCVTLEPSMKKYFNQGSELTSVIAAYAGEAYVGIVERADNRARDAEAAPADKGRFVHTSALLGGHATASARILSSVPDNSVTTIYDTNVERGEKPPAIGTIDSKNQIMEINDLKAMSGFLNKKNINAEAVNQVDLIYNVQQPLNILSTHPENKAKALLDLVPGTPYKKAYTIKLTDKANNEYASLVPDGANVKLEISNPELFQEKASAQTVQGSILRATVRQIETGSIDKSLEKSINMGDKDSYIDSLKQINVVEPAKAKENQAQTIETQLDSSSLARLNLVKTQLSNSGIVIPYQEQQNKTSIGVSKGNKNKSSSQIN